MSEQASEKEWHQIHVPHYFVVQTESLSGFMEGFNSAIEGTICCAVGDTPYGRAGQQGRVLGKALIAATERVLTGFGQAARTSGMVRPPEDHCPRCGTSMKPAQ